MRDQTTTPDVLAAAGSAAGQEAAGRATADAVAAVGGDAALVLVFPSEIDSAQAAAESAASADGALVAGMTGNGAIGPDGAIQQGCSALALAAATPVGVGLRLGAGRDLNRAARQATAEAIAGIGETPPLAIVLFTDTRSGDQAEAVAGAYAAAGPAVPIVGGGSGGAEPAQIAMRQAHQDTVVAIAIGGTTAVGVGEAHGCRNLGAPAIATRSEGRFLYELDGRPAAEVYLQRLGYEGADLGREDFEALAVTHPIGQPELSGQTRLRHVLGRGPDGGLECATHVPPNAAVNFTHQTPADIVDASGRAVRDACAALAPAPPRAALIFDCAGRKRAVADSLDQQVGGLIHGFGGQAPPLAGAFSHGEICRLRGAKGDRNHAVVVAAFA